MMSLKYIVDNNEYNPPLSDEFYEYVGSSGKFHAYRNKYWLPIAYCVNEDITAWSFDSDNPFEVQNDYFFRATGIDEVFNRLDITDSYFYNIDPISIGLDTGYMNYYKTSSDSTGTISFTVSPKRIRMFICSLNPRELKMFLSRSATSSIPKTRAANMSMTSACARRERR